MGRRLSGMVFAALALVVAGALGACESESSPPVSPTSAASTTSAPTASPSPTPTESASPDIPAAAREKTEKGAEAFVRYFFDQVNLAWTTPAPGLIASLSHPDCEFCATTEQTTRVLSDANQRYESEPLDVVEVEPLKGAPRGDVYLFTLLQQNRVEIVDSSGTAVASDMKKSLPSNVAVRWADGVWKMYAVEETQ